MFKRIAIVILFFLAGCTSNQPDIVQQAPQETLAPIIPGVVVPLATNLSYVVPDPNEQWSVVGSDLQAVNTFTTRIQIAHMLKPEDDTPLSDILPTLTAESLEIQSANGVEYAEGTNPVSDYVLYVDKGHYVLIFTLIDAASDSIDDVYIEDWRRIGIEGNLVEM